MTTTRRRIVRDVNGRRLLITRQRLVDLDETTGDNYAMTFKDFRAALASDSHEVRIKNLNSGWTLLVSFGYEYTDGINIGCHAFEPKVYARILKASGFKPKAAAAAAGR